MISDESADRHNTVVMKNAWILKHYKANPIVAYMHETQGDWMRPPDPDHIIGTSKIWWEEDKLYGSVTFETEDVNPLAEKIWKKVQNGTLRMASVGFIPHKMPVRGVTDLGEDEDIRYWKQSKSVELIEWSIVHIGSNRNAVKKSYDSYLRGCIEEPQEKEIPEKKLTEVQIKAAHIRSRRQLVNS